MNARLVELGLGPGGQPADSASAELAGFAARILALVSDVAIESETLKTNDFRTKLEAYRNRLANSRKGDPDTARTAEECVYLCQEYFGRARTYLLGRESEFAEVIEIMRMALGKLAGESKSFNVRLMGSSERMSRLMDIEDIRELKRQIAQEVRELNRVVIEKQKQDDLNYAKLSKRIEVLQTNLTRSREEGSLDPLTRVANRGSFDRAIDRWVTSHKLNAKPFVLAMIDIDNFKSVNDTHGHLVGDRVLLCAAQWLGDSVRANDFLARYGGEEFVVMMTDFELSQAEAKFTELLTKIASCKYEYKKDDRVCDVSFTVSCGLAELSFDENPQDLIRRADEALYEAKRAGKNRVVVAKKQKGLWKTLKPFAPFRENVKP